MLMVLPLQIVLTGALPKYKDLLETQLGSRASYTTATQFRPTQLKAVHTTQSSQLNMNVAGSSAVTCQQLN